MNHLTDPGYLKNIFRQYHIKPKDYMGQNFLIDEDVLGEIVSQGQLKKSDTVLEVGPGLGILTGELAKNVKRVIAVEKDPRLIFILKKSLTAEKNVEFVNDDIFRFRLDQNVKGDYKVIANIPYYLTSKLISYLLTLNRKPELMVLMLQKEVGERIVAQPGELSILAISVQFYADAEVTTQVPRDLFWPAPEVDSVIIKIEPKKKYPEVSDEKLFFRIVKSGFAGKRKQIHNTLGAGLDFDHDQALEILSKSQINPKSRPQDLAIEDWIKIYEEVKKLFAK